jgi:hypothetical protein
LIFLCNPLKEFFEGFLQKNKLALSSSYFRLLLLGFISKKALSKRPCLLHQDSTEKVFCKELKGFVLDAEKYFLEKFLGFVDPI